MTDRRPKILNGYEKLTFEEIRRSSGVDERQVFAKVRVADVLPINGSGLSDPDFEYALKAHFDFIVCDEDLRAEFCVEFDGPTHQTETQKQRDAAKLRICHRFDFPILRVTSVHVKRTYRNDISILAWIIDVYYLEKAFNKAQAEGHIPLDEPFDPFFVVSGGMESILDKDKRWPYQLAINERIRLKKLFDAKKIKEAVPAGLIGFDDKDNLRGCEFIRIDEAQAIYVESAMKYQHFPVELFGLLGELLLVHLSEKVQVYLETSQGAEDLEDVLAKVRSLKSRVRVITSHGHTQILDRIGR